jgi:hypothetical protein
MKSNSKLKTNRGMETFMEIKNHKLSVNTLQVYGEGKSTE